MKTRLSSRLFQELAQVARKSPDLLDIIGKELSGSPTRLYPFETVGDVVRKVLASQPPIAETDDFPNELGHSVCSILYAVAAAHIPPHEVLKSTSDTLMRDYSDVADLVLRFLRVLADSKALLLSFKATALREDNDNILLESKLVIDIRPIFDVDRKFDIVAHTFIHRLKITHRTSGDVETKIFTLGAEELDDLLSTLQRAKDKITSLRNGIGDRGLGIHLEHQQ